MKELVSISNIFRGQVGYKKNQDREGRKKWARLVSPLLPKPLHIHTDVGDVEDVGQYRERQSDFKWKVGETGPNVIHHINGIMGGKVI